MGRTLNNNSESRCSTLATDAPFGELPETTWASIDITSALLNTDIHEDDTVLVIPPPILVKTLSSTTQSGM